jgi:transposase-like protein
MRQLWDPQAGETGKRYSAEEKIRIVLDGLRGEHSIAELCRHEGIAEGRILPRADAEHHHLDDLHQHGRFLIQNRQIRTN